MSENIQERDQSNISQVATVMDRLGPFAYIFLTGALIAFLILVLKVIGAI